jgi:catechol 2,3-dioxygenase-like lactoylglutathione lyase family enzyme
MYVNHVGVAVPSVPDALAFYTQKMGFREAFRQTSQDGKLVSAYVQVSKNSFIEIQEANAQRPAGVSHFGLAVDSIDEAVKYFRGNGVTASDPWRAERLLTCAPRECDRPQRRADRAGGVDAGIAAT